MGSAARRHGAYGGEYMRTGLRLRARGGRRYAKYLVKLGQENTTKAETAPTKTIFSIRSTTNTCAVRLDLFYRQQKKRTNQVCYLACEAIKFRVCHAYMFPCTGIRARSIESIRGLGLAALLCPDACAYGRSAHVAKSPCMNGRVREPLAHVSFFFFLFAFYFFCLFISSLSK
jgi:hypothetical protein